MRGFNFWWEWLSEEISEELSLTLGNIKKYFESAFKAGE